MDYVDLATLLQFAACEQRVCVNITIISDGVPEDVESFFVNLERTPGLSGSISLDPVEAEINITDSNSTYTSSASITFLTLNLHCSGCGWSGEDILQCLGGCWCGGAVCCCVYA